MIDITFHSHATTVDNEAGVGSGHADVTLSARGVEVAEQLGQRYQSSAFDTIFCSDLQRSYKTAEIAFGNRFPIVKDARLRECNYGEFTGMPKQLIKEQRLQYIVAPFPGGESYLQVVSRMKSFLLDLAEDYSDKRVIIIGHAGTRLGLEYWLNNVSLEEALTNLKKDGRGVHYVLTEIGKLRIDTIPLD